MDSPTPGDGPIEYVGKADRRVNKTSTATSSTAPVTKADRRANQTTTATSSTAPVTAGSPAGGAAAGGRQQRSRFGWLWVLLLILGFFGLLAGIALLGGHVRAAVLGLACSVSACSTAGMTTAGWLVIATPAAVLIASTLLWGRLGAFGRRVLGVVAVLVCVVSATFVPGRRRDLSDLLDGPGSEVFADGVLWGLGAIGAVILALFALLLVAKLVPVVERRYNTIAVYLGVAVFVGALPLAIVKSDPTWVHATELFPPVLTMNGDTLTRTAADDQRGCDGVLPDDALLNRHDCYLTVRAEFTTDDSDAVVVFRAVLYRDEEVAARVRDGIPDGLDPVGVTGDAATIVSKTHSWVLVGAAKHADGRAITTDERPWVLWPLRQVSYHFIGAQAGIFIDPDPADEIRPRTP